MTKQSTDLLPLELADVELLRQFDGMYDDCDAEVRLHSKKVVIPRKARKCPGNFLEGLHDVASGKRGIVERALVDGQWRSCYTCEDCIMAWAKERGIR